MSRSLRTDPYPLRAARRADAHHRRVTIRVTRPRPGYHHPAGAADVERALARFGPAARYGLRRIELRQRAPHGPVIAALLPPGVVVLYEQPRPPWLLAGAPSAATLRRLHRAGATVRSGPLGARVDWPGHTLRDFMLFDGLLHEIGHHQVQHRAGRVGGGAAMRAADHERWADAYAAACRAAWPGEA